VILYPAIDIAGGRAVRLVQGDFDAETVYEDDPFEAARAWVRAGARYLHVVDLDGARTGSPQNLHHLERIAGELGVPVQCGGGLRSIEAVRDAIAAGAARVILGTAAFTDVDFLDEVVAEIGERTVVSIDTRGGFISTAGWTETTTLPAAEVIRRMQDRGVRTFVFTNVDKDGLLGGPDLDEVRAVAGAVRGRFMYSGGIGTREDLVALAGLRLVNLSGVIAGKALYERRFTVAEGQAALERRRPPLDPQRSAAAIVRRARSD
jgi:phosphoribosylformimino-5-aminoimidazole carboxamide ribotide isomerase